MNAQRHARGYTYVVVEDQGVEVGLVVGVEWHKGCVLDDVRVTETESGWYKRPIELAQRDLWRLSNPCQHKLSRCVIGVVCVCVCSALLLGLHFVWLAKWCGFSPHEWGLNVHLIVIFNVMYRVLLSIWSRLKCVWKSLAFKNWSIVIFLHRPYSHFVYLTDRHLVTQLMCCCRHFDPIWGWYSDILSNDCGIHSHAALSHCTMKMNIW
jgi:hypothetical protein